MSFVAACGRLPTGESHAVNDRLIPRENLKHLF
jgi:hypothetical protein